MAVEDHDEKLHPRCPPLGGEVPFRHCRTTNVGFPCSRIVGCWAAKIDVVAFLRNHYTVEELELSFRPGQSRLEILREALARSQEADSEG